MPSSGLIIAPPQALQSKTDALALVDEWLDFLNAQVDAGEISPSTRDTYANGIARFVDFAFAHRTVSGDVIRAWVAAMRKQHKPGTVNTWLSGVRSFFGWAQSKGYVPYNPADGIRGARRQGSKTRHKRDRLTDGEVRSLFDGIEESAIGLRDRAYLTLRAYTAVRDIELHRANLDDVQTRGNRTVLYVHGKGHSESDDFVVLMPNVETVLRMWMAVRGVESGPLFTSFSDRSQGQRLSLRAIRRMVKKRYAAAGIQGETKTSHSLRHAAISNAIEHGAPVQSVQTMARHEDISTTGIYIHETQRLEKPAEAFIDYGNGTKPG